MSYDTKQVIVMRKDLNMRKGKMIAQGAHASMKVFLDRGHFMAQDFQARDPYLIDMTPEMEHWIDGLFAKVCVGVNSEEELLEIHQNAIDAGIPCSLIQDAGFTEFNGVPTYTSVAVGPALKEDVDKITGHLKLL